MTPFMGGGPNSSIVVVVIFYALVGAALLAYLAYRLAIAMTLRSYQKALPADFRKLPEALLWMSILPGLPSLLNFVIFPVLANSYRKALNAEGMGDARGLNILSLTALLYPLWYLLIFVPFLVPNVMPDKLNSMFEVCIFLALIFGDVAVLAFMFVLFNVLKKHIRLEENPSDSHVSARRKNVMMRLSRE